MSVKKLAIAITMASTLCLAGSKLALASGNAIPLATCTATDLANGPGMGAFVYTGPNLTGTCWVLKMNQQQFGETWGGYDATDWNFPNDQIWSIWIGWTTRVKLYVNHFKTRDEGSFLTLTASEGPMQNLGSWGGNVSAIRLEDRLVNRVANCGTEPDAIGITVWERGGSGVGGDCTTYNQAGYANPAQMAFRNDTMSAFWKGRYSMAWHLCENSNWNSCVATFSQSKCGDMSDMSRCGASGNWNDRVSSIRHY